MLMKLFHKFTILVEGLSTKNRYVKQLLLTISILTLGLVFAFVKDDRKKLFSLGDSISLQYGPKLEQYLSGKFTVERKNSDSSAFKNLDVPVGANGGDSRMVLNYLKLKTEEPGFHPDLLLLNCGLHDIKRDRLTQKIAITEDEYRRNLDEIYTLLTRKKIPLIWINSTGVIDSIHRKLSGFDRFNSDLQKYNAIASDVFSKHKIPQIDLYGITEAQGSKRFVDHAHFSPEVRAVQAAYIAGFIQHFANSKTAP